MGFPAATVSYQQTFHMQQTQMSTKIIKQGKSNQTIVNRKIVVKLEQQNRDLNAWMLLVLYLHTLRGQIVFGTQSEDTL